LALKPVYLFIPSQVFVFLLLKKEKNFNIDYIAYFIFVTFYSSGSDDGGLNPYAGNDLIYV